MERIIKWYELLIELGPPRGYFPEPEKSKIIVHPTRVQEAKEAFKDLKLKVHIGHRYLGGYIGDNESEDKYLRDKVKDREEATAKLSGIAKDFPQAAYSVMQKSLQQEWQFLQRVTEYSTLINTLYQPIE